jgi:hypothetical protein
MKSIRISLVVGFGLTVLTLQSLQAGPKPAIPVPTNAAWFLHLDVEKLKGTEVGQYLLGELEKPEAQRALAGMQAIFNFDPRKTLKNCTLFSRGESPEDAVLVMRGTFDTERLTTLARAGQDYQSIRYRHYTIHGWVDARKRGRRAKDHRSYGVIPSPGVVVLGQKVARMQEALDLLERPEGSADGATMVPKPAIDAGAVVLLGAARPGKVALLPPGVAFLRSVKTLSLSAGETGGTLEAELTFESESEESARNLLAIAQGLLAWSSFQDAKPANGKLLQALSTAQKGSLVTLHLRLPAAEAVRLIEEKQTRKAAHAEPAERP